MRDSGEFEAMPKKEALLISRELEKLERNLGGIRNMERLPDAVFILDTKKEDIAVTEANKLGIPIVAVVDTNCDPDVIQYVIPGNDDAIRSGDLMCRVIADAVEEGRFIASRRGGAGAPAAAARRAHRRGGGRRSPPSRPRPAARPPRRRRARGPHRRRAPRPSSPRPRPRRWPTTSPPPAEPRLAENAENVLADADAVAEAEIAAEPAPTPPSPTPHRGDLSRWPSSPPRTSRPCARPPAPG